MYRQLSNLSYVEDMRFNKNPIHVEVVAEKTMEVYGVLVREVAKHLQGRR